MPDDKFLDYYIEMSEKFLTDESSYLVFSSLKELKYIKSQHPSLMRCNDSLETYNNILKYLQNVEVVVFHGFTLKQTTFIKCLPEKIKKVWMFWGNDGYGAIRRTNYIDRCSLINSYKKSKFNFVKFAYSFILENSLNKKHRELIKKMDYCATWVYADFELAKKINKNIKHLYFNYYCKELMHYEEISESDPNYMKLFLGNSADPSNNHIEALNYLSKINFKGDIICPLSYGGTPVYIETISKLGQNFFGNRFKALIDFMPLKDYQNLVNDCGIIWMNHKRQQAAGNLLFAFFSKKIVIISQNNPLNSTFVKWNLKFFDKEILKNINEIDNENLINNRKVLDDLTINKNEGYFKFLENTIN